MAQACAGTDARVLGWCQSSNSVLRLPPRVKVKIIMATNRPDTLDPALLRPEIPLPNEQARVDILKIHSLNVPKHGDIDWEAVVKLTDGFNEADMRKIVNQAVCLCILADRISLTTK